ncbi:hypothetical protein [Deinococcus koreensis]|uniref:Outer membrane protein beta-barrel domain-containing protein n=1 Tax=Deinococcus koreensis TaxID=2054903 RepID=A0A2K3UU56_9DEIO|nr:hypothetical protein [Deinococcus koreensis]PNY80073.1 hypothetical protein CVO96_00735 [Deinococcus koreensis]
MSSSKTLLALLLPSTLALSGHAHAVDAKLGLNSSLSLGCQVAGVRAGIQADKVGAYAQAAYCTSNLEGRSGTVAFGAGLSYDLFRAGNVTTYALIGADLQNKSSVLHGGLGARYGIALLPVEAYLEAGVQRINTVLQPVYGPRLALGLSYRINVDNVKLQGSIPAPLTLDDGTGNTTTYAGSAPAECKLTAEQDIGSARGAASAAADEGLSAAASAYGSVYSNVGYSISVAGVGINGNSAQVSGSVRITATKTATGEKVSGTYGGTVNLVREGCGWRATGYKRGGE